MLTFDELLAGEAVVVILRGQSPERTLALAEAVWDAGAGIIEVPIQDPVALAALEITALAGRSRGHPVGAGTVLTPGQAEQARAAGAAFTVAPGFSPDVLAASTAAGLPHLPGVATATEVQRAVAAGCQWLKAFPASALGPAWFREMRGPFPGVSFVATGGITAATAGEFLAAGARAVGVGSAATRPGGLAELLAAMADAGAAAAMTAKGEAPASGRAGAMGDVGAGNRASPRGDAGAMADASGRGAALARAESPARAESLARGESPARAESLAGGESLARGETAGARAARHG